MVLHSVKNWHTHSRKPVVRAVGYPVLVKRGNMWIWDNRSHNQKEKKKLADCQTKILLQQSFRTRLSFLLTYINRFTTYTTKLRVQQRWLTVTTVTPTITIITRPPLNKVKIGARPVFFLREHVRRRDACGCYNRPRRRAMTQVTPSAVWIGFWFTVKSRDGCASDWPPRRSKGFLASPGTT